MEAVVEEIGPDLYPLYDGIPSWYIVESVFRVEVVDGGLGGFRLVEEEVAAPYAKGGDDQGEGGPSHWARRSRHFGHALRSS